MTVTQGKETQRLGWN